MRQHISRAQAGAMFSTIIFCDEFTNIAALCGISAPYNNAGGLGWNWDLYDVNGVGIVAGYRSFPRYAARIDYDTARKLEKHLKGLRTQKGRINAVTRFIEQYAQ